MRATKSLKKLPIDTTIYTDASLEGWGQFCEKSETRGMWTKQEQALHINALELLGAKQALTNCMHGYDQAHNVHANSVTGAQTFVHGINSSEQQ